MPRRTAPNKPRLRQCEALNLGDGKSAISNDMLFATIREAIKAALMVDRTVIEAMSTEDIFKEAHKRAAFYVKDLKDGKQP